MQFQFKLAILIWATASTAVAAESFSPKQILYDPQTNNLYHFSGQLPDGGVTAIFYAKGSAKPIAVSLPAEMVQRLKPNQKTLGLIETGDVVTPDKDKPKVVEALFKFEENGKTREFGCLIEATSSNLGDCDFQSLTKIYGMKGGTKRPNQEALRKLKGKGSEAADYALGEQPDDSFTAWLAKIGFRTAAAGIKIQQAVAVSPNGQIGAANAALPAIQAIGDITDPKAAILPDPADTCKSDLCRAVINSRTNVPVILLPPTAVTGNI